MSFLAQISVYKSPTEKGIMRKKKEPFVVSSDVIEAISEGRGIDPEFDEKVKQAYRKDIQVRKNVDKVIWKSMEG
jgi:hypothetical protein